MNNTFTQTNFTGGEVSPRLLGRSDMVRYGNGARSLRNFVVQKHGGVDRRPGTAFVAKTKSSGVNTPEYVCGTGEALPVLSVDAYCKTAASNTDAGDTAFATPTNAQGAPNGVSAFAGVTGGQTSKYLHCTNFTFSVPSDATILGIGVAITRRSTLSSTISDHTIQLIKAGSRTGDNNAGAFTWGTTFGDATYGADDDLWGTTLTPAEANASDFGVAIRVSAATSDTAYVDAVKVTIYYQEPAADTSDEDLQSRGKARLIPFQFSSDQPYVLEFGNLYMRVFKSDGQVLSSGLPYEITTPYLETELDEIKYTQSADILYLCHPDHPPMQLLRVADDDWDLLLFEPDDGPYGPINTDATKLMAVSSVTPGSVTITASGAGWGGVGPFLATHVASASQPGLLIRIKTTGTDWGWAEVTGFTTTLIVTATLVDAPASTATTVHWRLGVWNADEGWPHVPMFHQERLWFAATDEYPQSIWASQTNVFNSFEPADLGSEVVADDNGLSYTIADDQVNTIRWMFSTAKGLVLGTSGGEFIVSASDLSGVITPTSIRILRQSTNGSLDTTRPVQIGNSVLYVQRHGRKLREMVYQFDLDQHVSEDLTIMSEHLGLNRFKEIAYQAEPYAIVWVRDEDGDLFSMTFDRTQDVVAWAPHVIGGVFDIYDARVESICVVQESDEDRLWMIVKREINGRLERYVEKLHDFFEENELVSRDAFFVDSGVTYDGWNYDQCKQMRLEVEDAESVADEDFEEDLFGFIEATGHTPFTADSVGTYYRFDADLGAGDELWIDVVVTEYVSSTRVAVKFKNDIPESLRTVDIYNWAELADSIDGLDHLEGEEVDILVDGGVHPVATVSAGVAALETGDFPTRAAVIHAGLVYTARMETLPVTPDNFGVDLRSRVKSIYKAALRFHRTIGGEFGTSDANMDPIASRAPEDAMGNPSTLFTGVKIAQLDGRYEQDVKVIVQQNDPLPMQLLSVHYDIDTSAV